MGKPLSPNPTSHPVFLGLLEHLQNISPKACNGSLNPSLDGRSSDNVHHNENDSVDGNGSSTTDGNGSVNGDGSSTTDENGSVDGDISSNTDRNGSMDDDGSSTTASAVTIRGHNGKGSMDGDRSSSTDENGSVDGDGSSTTDKNGSVDGDGSSTIDSAVTIRDHNGKASMDGDRSSTTNGNGSVDGDRFGSTDVNGFVDGDGSSTTASAVTIRNHNGKGSVDGDGSSTTASAVTIRDHNGNGSVDGDGSSGTEGNDSVDGDGSSTTASAVTIRDHNGNGSVDADGSSTNASAVTTRACFHCDKCRYNIQLEKLKMDVSYIIQSLEEQSSFERKLAELEALVKGKSILPELLLNELTTAVLKLKFQLPSTSYPEFQNPLLLLQQGVSDPDTESSTSTPRSHQELETRYEGLNDKERKCLWCISVFDGEVKKRVLINWWIGLELLPVSIGPDGRPVSSSEVAGEKMLRRLKVEGFIQQVVRKKRQVDRWMIEPAARSVLMSMLDGEVLLLKSGNLIDNLVNHKVKTVFNLNKSSIGDAEAERLAPLENLTAVHLGRSQVTEPRPIIRMQNLNLIMEHLYKQKELRLLSLQGIPSIRELPPSSPPPAILRVLPPSSWPPASLMVLDLSECQALESLPWWTWGLKNLTHLDVSGCIILGSTPKEISLLDKLEVLKGVVVGPRYGRRNCCTLKDLRKLVKLHKLSICVSTTDFPQDQDLRHLASIPELVKLKIIWIYASVQGQRSADDQAPNSARAKRFFASCFRSQTEAGTGENVFRKLEKLDLWCAPIAAATVLLDPVKFPTLKKLYVKGAQLVFQQLGIEKTWSTVKTLRLLFLPHLQMDWTQLENSFPQLSYLEMQGCPNSLDEFPQNGDNEGFWEVKFPRLP